jgi:hypothetical protein
VVAASWSEDADSSAAAEFTLTPALVTCSTRRSDVVSIALNESPRVFSSVEPAGRTRTVRSPSAASPAASVSRRIGRVVRAASATDTATATNVASATKSTARSCWAFTGASTAAAGSSIAIVQPRQPSRPCTPHSLRMSKPPMTSCPSRSV